MERIERVISIYDLALGDPWPEWFGLESAFDREQLSTAEWSTLEAEGRVVIGGGAQPAYLVTLEASESV